MNKAAQVRLHVAIAKLGLALGVELDPKRPDHELLEALAERAQGVAWQAHPAWKQDPPESLTPVEPTTGWVTSKEPL